MRRPRRMLVWFYAAKLIFKFLRWRRRGRRERNRRPDKHFDYEVKP